MNKHTSHIYLTHAALNLLAFFIFYLLTINISNYDSDAFHFFTLDRFGVFIPFELIGGYELEISFNHLFSVCNVQKVFLPSKTFIAIYHLPGYSPHSSRYQSHLQSILPIYIISKGEFYFFGVFLNCQLFIVRELNIECWNAFGELASKSSNELKRGFCFISLAQYSFLMFFDFNGAQAILTQSKVIFDFQRLISYSIFVTQKPTKGLDSSLTIIWWERAFLSLEKHWYNFCAEPTYFSACTIELVPFCWS